MINKTSIIYLTVLLFTFNGLGQKDTSKFINKLYFELNGGVGIFKHSEKYQSPSGSKLIQYKNVSYNFSANLHYKNARLSTGFSGQAIYFDDDGFTFLSLFTGINILNIEKNKNIFFGPKISYGYIKRAYNNTAFSRFSLGIIYYYKKFHIGINHDWIKPNYDSFLYVKPRNLYLEVGYAFNLQSFQKK